MNKITTLKEYQDLLSTRDSFIIKVSAQWCGQCKVLSARINELNEEFQNKFVEVDADEADEELIDLLNVRNIPLLIYYVNGKERDRKVGIDKDGFFTLTKDDS